MTRIPSHEGTIPFPIASVDRPCYTWYKAFGDLSCGTPPVVMLHGGPGSGHQSLLPFAELWPRCGLPVILYDQIGCGASTHLREKAGDGSFWNEALFVAELDNLIDHLKLRNGFHLYGHSWGGMLSAAFATRRPRGLQSLVLASAPASKALSLEGIAIRKKELPFDIQTAMNEANQSGDFECDSYQHAMDVLIKTNLCRLPITPAELVKSLQNQKDDNTVYSTMNGPSLSLHNGTQLGWTVIPRLPQINVPCLVTNGEYDTSHDISQVPYFELIPRVRWYTYNNASHAAQFETPERCLQIVGEFLSQQTIGNSEKRAN